MSSSQQAVGDTKLLRQKAFTSHSRCPESRFVITEVGDHRNRAEARKVDQAMQLMTRCSILKGGVALTATASVEITKHTASGAARERPGHLALHRGQGTEVGRRKDAEEGSGDRFCFSVESHIYESD